MIKYLHFLSLSFTIFSRAAQFLKTFHLHTLFNCITSKLFDINFLMVLSLTNCDEFFLFIVCCKCPSYVVHKHMISQRFFPFSRSRIVEVRRDYVVLMHVQQWCVSSRLLSIWSQIWYFFWRTHILLVFIRLFRRQLIILHQMKSWGYVLQMKKCFTSGFILELYLSLMARRCLLLSFCISFCSYILALYLKIPVHFKYWGKNCLLNVT